MTWKTLTQTLLFSGLVALPAFAGNTMVLAVQDNTLYESLEPATEGIVLPSNGAGIYFFAGATAQGQLRRGLLAFDIAGAVPAGSVITEVTLTLEMSRTLAGPTMVELRRVTSDWGEGSSDAPGEEGGGAAPTTGDATWIHTFFDTGFWGSSGGDFSAVTSASQSVDSTGSYAWGSTPEMVADVQSWLDSPATNYGWLILGEEGVSPSAKRFNTRENGAGAPQLAITFQAPVPTTPVWILGIMTLGLLAMGVWRLKASQGRVSVRSD